MRFVIQRVNYAKCTIDGNITGSIKKGTISSMPIFSVHLTAGCDQVSIGGCTALTRSSCGMW